MINNLPPLHYYKWHWQAWRANRSVQQMSYIEKGLYRELLDECWVEGCIPNNIEMLAEICNCPIDVMANAWLKISKCFVDIDGNLINTRIEKERTEKDSHRIKMAIAGKKGGASKSLKEDGFIQKPSKSQAKASKSHIEEKSKEEESKGEIVAKATDTVKESTTITLNNLAVILPDLPRQVASDFLTVRKAKKLPLTQTALAGISREAEIAGLTLTQAIAMATSRGWGGFKASWLDTDKTFAEKTQDYKDQKALKTHHALLNADDQTLKELGLL